MERTPSQPFCPAGVRCACAAGVPLMPGGIVAVCMAPTLPAAYLFATFGFCAFQQSLTVLVTGRKPRSMTDLCVRLVGCRFRLK